MYQRHLLQTVLVDRVLGVFIRRLQKLDLYDRSLVAIIADHGIAFEPGYPKRVTTSTTVGELRRCLSS